jgi:hypothetical protein
MVHYYLAISVAVFIFECSCLIVFCFEANRRCIPVLLSIPDRHFGQPERGYPQLIGTVMNLRSQPHNGIPQERVLEYTNIDIQTFYTRDIEGNMAERKYSDSPF